MKFYKSLHPRKVRGPGKLNTLPKHIAIIPDGNRRWARDRGLKPWDGHKVGAGLTEKMIDWCFIKYDIPHITVYGLSIENLKKRPKTELNRLMNIYKRQFRKLAKDERVHKHKIKVQVLGDISKFPKDVADAINYAMEKTKTYKKHILTFLMPYSGRYEIVKAIKDISKNGFKNLTEKNFSQYLLTNGIGDPDLIIRTAERRMSNFMLWQSAYSEIFFMDKYWPDFALRDLENVLEEFSERERNFGE